MKRERVIRLGTRRSRLALIQAQLAAAALAAGGARVQIVEIDSAGDLDQGDVWGIGVGVFTSAIEEALAQDRIDVAAHSAKDLPTRLAAGLVLAAALPREDPRDVLVSRAKTRLSDLAAGAKVGTSSARRAAAVLAIRPDVLTVPIRGNVPTRIAKVESGEFDAAILAAAGINRLGLGNCITQVFEPDIMIPAAGQGVIALEVRADDAETALLAGRANDAAAMACLKAERAVLAALEAGCRTPLGALALPEGGRFRLRARLWRGDGRAWSDAEARFEHGGEEAAGRTVAAELRRGGAK